MADLEAVAERLRGRGYEVAVFGTAAEAARHVAGECGRLSVGFGDSRTLEAMGLRDMVDEASDPAAAEDNDEFLRIARDALLTDVFITSANALTEDGVIVNLDGTGNRIAGSLFGHRRVVYVISRNKVAASLDEAVRRVRNVAAPLNAKRLGLRTPCARRGDRCYDCSSPDRICNALLIQLRPVNDMESEVVLIDEDMGYRRGPILRPAVIRIVRCPFINARADVNPVMD